MKAMTAPSSPALLPHGGEGSFVSRVRDFHTNRTSNLGVIKKAPPGRSLLRALLDTSDRLAAAQRGQQRRAH